MRKKSCYLITLFLLLILFLPLVEGALFRMHYLHLFTLVNQDKRMNIEVVEYDEGWFHSRVRLHVTINKALTNLALIDDAVALDIWEDITHGPIIYDSSQGKVELGYAKIVSDIYLDQKLKSLLIGKFLVNGELHVAISSEFDGDWSGKITLPEVSVSIENFGKITWHGLGSNFKLVQAPDYIKLTKFDGKIELISLMSDAKNTDTIQVTIPSTDFVYHMRHKKTGLISGYTDMRTPEFGMLRSGGLKYIFKDFAMHTAISVDEDTLYNTNFTVNINDVTVPSDVIHRLSDLSFTLAASNFSTHALFEYINNLKPNNDKVDLNMIEAILSKIITPNSMLKGNLTFNTDLGAFTCHFKSSWRTDMPMPQNMNDIISSAEAKFHMIMAPNVLLKLTEIYNGVIQIVEVKDGNAIILKYNNDEASQSTATIKIDTPQEMVDELVRGGFIGKDDHNNYETRLTIQSGVWKLNGRPLD